MSHTASSHPLTVALLGLALLSSVGVARAEGPPVYFVGVQRGCERDGSMDHALERRMFQKGTPVALLHKPAGEPLPPCYGERCGQWVRQACPTSPGRVLGGSVVQGKELLQVRLWLYDLQSGQTAYQDDYCQGCDILSALSTQAARLIAAPVFGPAPGAVPSYCTATATSSAGSRASAPTGPLLLTVFGDGKHRPALLAALKQQLGLLGYKVEPLSLEASKSTPDVKKLVAGQRNARVLGVEVPKEGKLQLFLYDQKTEQTEGKLLDCEECDKDRESLIAKVQPEVATIMEHCFGEACSAGSPSAVPPPPEACTPFPDPVCGGEAWSTGSAAPRGRYIDPATAKLVKGSLWSLFGVSAATAICLFVANEFVTTERLGQSPQGILTQPAWAIAGFSALTFAIAVPVTVLLPRASSPKQAAPTSSQEGAIQCPR